MNHMALIISLKDPIEEKYFSIFEKIFTPRGETQRARGYFDRQYFSSKGTFNGMISAIWSLIFRLIF